MIYQFSMASFNDLVNAALKVKILLLVILCFLISSLSYWVLLKPSLKVFFSLKEQSQQLQRQILQAKSELNNLRMNQEKFRVMQKSGYSMLQTNHQLINGMIEKITNMGKDNDLEFLSIKNSVTIQKEFYNVTSVVFVVTGSYQQLTQLLNKIFQLDKIVTIDSFSLLPRNKLVDQQKGSKQLLLTLSIKVYEIGFLA